MRMNIDLSFTTTTSIFTTATTTVIIMSMSMIWFSGLNAVQCYVDIPRFRIHDWGIRSISGCLCRNWLLLLSGWRLGLLWCQAIYQESEAILGHGQHSSSVLTRHMVHGTDTVHSTPLYCISRVSPVDSLTESQSVSSHWSQDALLCAGITRHHLSPCGFHHRC